MSGDVSETASVVDVDGAGSHNEGLLLGGDSVLTRAATLVGARATLVNKLSIHRIQRPRK